MRVKKLTDLAVRQMKPDPNKRLEIPDPGKPGLYLLLLPSGHRSWAFRYRNKAGVQRKFNIGPFDKLGVAAAHIEADKANDEVLAGRDPAAAKRQGVPDDDTVTAHAALYERLHVATLAQSTRTYIEAELDRIIDALGSRAVASVTQKDVQRIIDQAMERGESARNTTWKVCKAFFAWVAARSDIAESPAAKIKRPSKDNERKRWLTDDEIRIVWKAADAAAVAPGALVKLLLLTGCRRDEICYLPHANIQADKIVFPQSLTKNDEPHTVPITPMIRRALDTLPKSGTFALTGNGKGLGGHTKAREAIKTPGLDHWTYHDLRRSFASGMARLGVPIQVTELCLNHKSGVSNKPLVRIYQQHDYAAEVKAAFEKWSAHVAGLVGEDMKIAA